MGYERSICMDEVISGRKSMGGGEQHAISEEANPSMKNIVSIPSWSISVLHAPAPVEGGRPASCKQV